VRAALEAAWAYYSSAALHRRGVEYLAGRDIDVTALEAETGRAVIGHTPVRIDGLIAHLRNDGFRADELVDTSLACRYPDGRCFDFFRHRAIVPIGDNDGSLAGLIGRATTDAGGPKYLNMSRTYTYDKATALYRPDSQMLDRHANVIVCEGTLDALASAAQAASSGLSDRYAPVAPSGLALSDKQLRDILSIHPLPPVFSGDGDPAGRRASVEWATRAALAGRESVVTNWPDGHDPASWIATHGETGLLALTRKGCLEPTNTSLRPRHAGEIIAQAALWGVTSGLVSLEEALAAALAPGEHLQGSAAARYITAVARTSAPTVSTAELEAVHQRCTDTDYLRPRPGRRWAPADLRNSSEFHRRPSRESASP
jgi:DNA primase